MSKITKTQIINKSAELFALSGSEAFTIRKLASSLNIAPSVIYHYFKNEDELFLQMFNTLNTNLGLKRKALPKIKTAKQMLKQIINFQLDNALDVVAILKYYLYFRKNFKKQKIGYLPEKSTLHIEEVLQYGLLTKEFKLKNIKGDALVITHAINGFLLEYYPNIPKDKERTVLVNRIYAFLIKALKGGDNNE